MPVLHVIRICFFLISYTLDLLVDYVRSELTDKDRMAVINFENSATLVHDLLLMNDSNKQTTTAVCSQLRPGGGTSIVSGLDAAYNMISTRATSNPITSVFLLTDGIDSSHMARKKVNECRTYWDKLLIL